MYFTQILTFQIGTSFWIDFIVESTKLFRPIKTVFPQMERPATHIDDDKRSDDKKVHGISSGYVLITFWERDSEVNAVVVVVVRLAETTRRGGYTMRHCRKF